MRVKPLVGEVAWFGPRRAGWGWAPVTWQGWVVIAAALVAVLISMLAQSGPAVAVSIAAVPLLIAISVVKGTSPGGPAAWRQFQRVRSGEVDAADVAETKTSTATKVLLSISGVVLAVVIAMTLLVTVAPGAIAPPTSVEVTNGRLHVDVRGPYAVFALRRGLSVPLSNVTYARYEPKARDLPRGSRFGTYIPGGLVAGSFGGGDAKAFWALQHDGALVITVTGQSFSTLVVEVRDPDAVLDDLAAAGVPTLNPRRG